MNSAPGGEAENFFPEAAAGIVQDRLGNSGGECKKVRVKRSNNTILRMLPYHSGFRKVREICQPGGNLMNPMELALWSIAGGLAGTALMDIVGEFGERIKFTSGGR